jgi:hypothetical protein
MLNDLVDVLVVLVVLLLLPLISFESGILLLMILAGALAQLFGYNITLLVLFAKVCVPIFALNV